MQPNEDKPISIPVPFLKDKTVLYVGGEMLPVNGFVDEEARELYKRFKAVGYKYLYLPELAKHLDLSVLEYMFPGEPESMDVEEMYRRIRDFAGLGEEPGLLYKQSGSTYFHVIPDAAREDVWNDIGLFIEQLREPRGIEVCEKAVRLHRKAAGRAKEPKGFLEDIAECGASITFNKVSCEPTFEKTLEPHFEDVSDLDERTRKILLAWERVEEEFGITIEDLDVILGYRIKLSRLSISTSGKIVLSDWNGQPEVKMDDLTKALYFFYLRHPEGVALKELQIHEQEFLKYYEAISGRESLLDMRKTVSKFLDPYENSLNVSISRIKKAFKTIVGDRIARFYYVDGRYAEPRSIALDRDYVIWEH